MKFYIRHEDVKMPENGVAYFGPFHESELYVRLNDAYADALAECGNVDVVRLSKWKSRKLFINSREFWLEQVRDIHD